MLQYIQGCLLGAQIGDALGMPVETMSHEEIMELNGGRGIQNFIDPVQRRIPEMQDLKAGDTTDDWQLTAVVARSIIDSRGWNQANCAQKHVDALKQSLFGWGKTTENSVREIMASERNLEELPRDLGPNKGCGNGIAMKVSPLALFYAMRNRRRNMSRDNKTNLRSWVMELGFLTHPDPRASFAAYAIALLLNRLINSPIQNSEEGLAILEMIITRIAQLERMYGEIRWNPVTVSDRLRTIPLVIENAEDVRKVIGCSFNALDTAGFAIATFIRNPRDFKKGVLEAINAGGDTDTHGSIVGALIGANCGISAIPTEWASFSPKFAESRTIAQELFLVGNE